MVKQSDERPGGVREGEFQPRVLVVDDEAGVLKAVQRLLKRAHFEVLTAASATEAISILRQKEVAVVISDQIMPGMTGIELLTLIRHNWPETVGIMMTACGDLKLVESVVNRRLVHYFVTKPWDKENFRNLVTEAVDIYRKQREHPEGAMQVDRGLLRELREHASKAAFSLARAVDARDRYTHRHSENVAAFAVIVGRAMGLDAEALEELRIGGLLHDVGKIGVPDEILLKPGRLTDEEFRAIKMHPVIGVSIIEPINFPWNISAIIRQHHENHNGTGYPLGVGGKDIVLPARIVHVVDAYEAMSADRVYRTARPVEWIMQEFARCKGTQFDPEVADIFLAEFGSGRLTVSTMAV